MIPTKILLFGKNGQLGWELQQVLSKNSYALYAFSSDELNLNNLQALKNTINEIKPDVIINAAAYTAVDNAEKEPEIAKHINAEAPSVMAECSKRMNAVLIHYSTDYVFDGKKGTPYHESDLTNPLNMYGKTKLEGEQAISQIGGAYIILRTSWVYSMRGDNFVTKVLAWSHEKEEIKIVTDQIGSPTWARALAQITSKIKFSEIKEKSGTYHLGGLGTVSRFDFAKEILRLDSTGRQVTQKLIPALTSEFPSSAIRPLYAALDCTKFEQTFHLQLPNWEDSLKFSFMDY